MAIGISTDLKITLLAQDLSTPTMTGIYDAGSPADTYVPGKDFSPTDGVSTNTISSFNFSIAFDSISNQLYTLDKVYIQSGDDPKTDGTGLIFGRWSNQDPDPTNITDDGQNTIIVGYNFNMTSIVFDSSANIKSDATVATAITATAQQNSIWWKSKIMPKIQVVAVKDGIEKVSEPLQLPTVRLSTVGNLISTLSSNGGITYITLGSQTGFNVPFYINTSKDYIANISRIRDDPEFDLITYEVKLTTEVNGIGIPLTTNNFILSGNIVSYSYSAGVLTMVAKQPVGTSFVGVLGSIFVPFNPSSLTEATVTVNGIWNQPLPIITDFINEYLFTQYAVGNLNQQVVVEIIPVPPEDKITIQENVSGNLQNQTAYQTLDITHYSCIKTQNSTFVRLLDSPLASFGDTTAATYSYFDIDTNAYTGGNIPTDAYIIQYTHYDFPISYDANSISQQVLTGGIPLQTYAQVIASGKTPNIVAITITKDLYAGRNIDTDKTYNFTFMTALNIISQADFRILYDANTQNSYPSYLYSYISMNTCYASVNDAYNAVGDLLYDSPNVDSFPLRNGNVYFNLGTTTKNGPRNIERFNTTSYVEQTIPFDTVDGTIEYALYTMQGGGVTVVNDYTKEYCLSIQWGIISSSTDNAFTTIPAGTEITITLMNNLVPYMYIVDMPYINVPIDNGVITTVPILNYSLFGSKLTLTIPIEISLRPNNVCVPVKFIVPSNNLPTGFTAIDFSKPLVYKEDPNSLIYGFDTKTMMFTVNTYTRDFTLNGAQIDTTGLFVSPTIYDRGQSITYIATVYNQSFSPSSDYYMSMTVPTNKYNPVETSNNALNAYITAINLTNPNTILYYQIEPNVTPTDIYIMKTINRPSGPSLQQYFNTTIVSTWIQYIQGSSLPSNVVMMVGFTPNVLQNTMVRIDYDVRVDVPTGAEQTYVNDAVFNYYSSGSNLEAQSNVVSIRNRIAEAIPVIKTPSVQVLPLLNGTEVNFKAYFTAPQDYLLFKTFTVSDKLHPALAYDLANIKVEAYPNTPIAFTMDLDASTNTLTIHITNNETIGGI